MDEITELLIKLEKQINKNGDHLIYSDLLELIIRRVRKETKKDKE